MMRDASGKNPRKPLLEGVDQGLLRQLPRLLGQGGMSEAAYKRAAKCIRLVVICCEDSKTPMLNELESELHKCVHSPNSSRPCCLFNQQMHMKAGTKPLCNYKRCV